MGNLDKMAKVVQKYQIFVSESAEIMAETTEKKVEVRSHHSSPKSIEREEDSPFNDPLNQDFGNRFYSWSPQAGSLGPIQNQMEAVEADIGGLKTQWSSQIGILDLKWLKAHLRKIRESRYQVWSK